MGKSERTGFQPTTTRLLTGRTVGQILKSIMNRNFLHKTDPEYLQFLGEYLQYQKLLSEQATNLAEGSRAVNQMEEIPAEVRGENDSDKGKMPPH